MKVKSYLVNLKLNPVIVDIILCFSVTLLFSIYIAITYIQKYQQASTNLQSINLTLESRLNYELLKPIQNQLNTLSLMIDPYLIDDLPKEKENIEKNIEDLKKHFDKLSRIKIIDKYDAPLIAKSVDKMRLNEIIFKSTKDNILVLAVPLFNSKSEHKGWISTSVSLKTIQILFSEVELGNAGVLALRLINPSAMIVQQPQLSTLPSYFEPDVIDKQLEEGSNEGVQFMFSEENRESRLYGYKRVGLYPLVLVTGFATKDLMAEWYLNSQLTGVLCFFICIIFILIHRLSNLFYDGKCSTEAYESKEEYIRLLLNSVGHPIFGVNLRGECTFHNKSCAQLLGCDNNIDLTSNPLNIHFIDVNGSQTDILSKLLCHIRKNLNFHCEDNFITDTLNKKTPVEIRAYPNVKNKKLIGAVVTLQDISERKYQEKQIRYMAYHDALTGLPNRWLLRDNFDQLIADKKGENVFLLYLDLDHFKTINDSLGHYAGDSVLHVIAKRLLSFKTKSCILSRLGGDEYLMLVSCSHKQLKRLLSDMIAEIQQPIQLESQQISVTSSIGISTYIQHGTDFESLLKASDMALYKAKEDGRNTYRFYHNSMGKQGLRLLMIQTELREAISKNQLFIQYQPQLDLKTGKLIGVEALLRWNHPKEGLISPAEFIPAAESNGMIIPISNWLLQEVCKQAMQWKQQGVANLVVAVNCSAVQFRQGDLVAEVRQALESSGLPAHELELELTESMLLQDSERVMKIMAQLKTLGIKFSIDDFGTGYSNMAYLKRFAVDKLKIDQSFVKGIANNPNDKAIVQSIIALAHSFNLKAIAEGVEDCASASILSANQCDEAQGYLYSKPLYATEFLQWFNGYN
ncbi:EAL domain-containing protein [Shewanella ulleungensis]|uniref:Diguanylate cyclase/phosphodiesterase with PAS/PAC sensor(S) n=1 Tax=Shewanella ulleungensis TaxID=2282699 RepID=A0ABQ2QCI0_9GAMM|nr:EAL domain-containing protein [Shewanella ulleungensis]MCL1148861.1 EAL domain-containing protein [Shewanella ulleungensis]GGP75143.1 hypothetical protein GCM10009410_03980 [Shewanella ulleungensis]